MMCICGGGSMLVEGVWYISERAEFSEDLGDQTFLGKNLGWDTNFGWGGTFCFCYKEIKTPLYFYILGSQTFFGRDLVLLDLACIKSHYWALT